MIKTLRQARAAASLLSPGEIRDRANRAVHVGLVAATGAGYAELEDFLLPASLPHEVRMGLMERVHRATDPDVPETVDLVLYGPGLDAPDDAYAFQREDDKSLMERILSDHEDLALAMGRQFPAFRPMVVEDIIQSVARENALFAIATALPNIVPNLIELPWAFGEFASDAAFLTANQVRMAFLIAAACGQDPGLGNQKAEILSIVAGAFGWRAIARELVGKIPLGGGLIPKGAIAYAGTFAVGRGLEYFHHANSHLSPAQREEVYQHGLERGRGVAAALQAENTEP